MPITVPSYQLMFNLDLPEEEHISALSADEVRIREEVARKEFESGASWELDQQGNKIAPYLFELYLSLRVGRWPFRVAALIMWLGTPKKYRWPKTQDQLANLLGMSSDRQFSVWRAKNPGIDAMVGEVWKKSAVERLSDSLEAMYTVAAQDNYKGKYDRELHFKLAGVLKDRSEIDLKSEGGSMDEVLKSIPFGKLLSLAGVDTPEKISEFKAKIEKDRMEQEALQAQETTKIFDNVTVDAKNLNAEIKKDRKGGNNE